MSAEQTAERTAEALASIILADTLKNNEPDLIQQLLPTLNSGIGLRIIEQTLAQYVSLQALLDIDPRVKNLMVEYGALNINAVLVLEQLKTQLSLHLSQSHAERGAKHSQG